MSQYELKLHPWQGIHCIILLPFQSSKFTPEHLDERIEAFFKWFLEDKLANMEPEEYQQMVDTLVKLKKAADVRLGEEVGGH